MSVGPFLNLLRPTPANPKAPVKAPPSTPNLSLLVNCLAALSLLVPLFSLSIAVGPPNKSPKVTTSSTSPTNTLSANPLAAAPPAYSNAFPFLFNANS